MIISDLNKIVNSSEKMRGRDLRQKRMFLAKFLHNAKGLDLRYIGNWFTWFQKQEGRVVLRERLDRVVANGEWIDLFPRCVVHHLDLEESDHLPILLKLDGEEETKRRLFRCLQA